MLHKLLKTKCAKQVLDGERDDFAMLQARQIVDLDDQAFNLSMQQSSFHWDSFEYKQLENRILKIRSLINKKRKEFEENLLFDLMVINLNKKSV